MGMKEMPEAMLEAMLEAMRGGDEDEDEGEVGKKDYSLAGILKAFGRVPLTGLKRGDVLKQIVRDGAKNEAYHMGKYCVFVKYLDGDGFHFRDEGGNNQVFQDILVATAFDGRDGEMLCYAVDSTAFVKATEEEIAQAMQE